MLDENCVDGGVAEGSAKLEVIVDSQFPISWPCVTYFFTQSFLPWQKFCDNNARITAQNNYNHISQFYHISQFQWDKLRPNSNNLNSNSQKEPVEFESQGTTVLGTNS